MVAAPSIYSPSVPGAALRQGEILSGMEQVRLSLSSVGTDQLRVELVNHPYAIIVSQDCDLEWDFKARHNCATVDKLIPSVLFCEVVAAEALRGRPDIKSDIWRRIQTNKDERYHFLQAVGSNQDYPGEGLPELGIDFKRFFTIPTDEVYRRFELGCRRRCRLVSPYAEHLSTRYCCYLFRIALPADHFSEPVRESLNR